MALDIQAQNLAKAIRQVESGNVPQEGRSGELKSRYQFMPGTWKSAAKEILGDENAPLTLENENRVAYERIKRWKDAGYKPDQIASMWNSGKPDYAGNVGVNSAGVAYDTPAYVNKVRAEYEKLKGMTPSVPQAASGVQEQGVVAGTPTSAQVSMPQKSLVETPKKESFLKFLPQAAGETAVEFGKDIARPFTRTAGTVVSGIASLFGKAPTEEEGREMGMFEPYKSVGGALGGTAEIAATLLPEAKEAQMLLKSANAFLKGRTALGLGKPKTQAAKETIGRIFQPKNVKGAADVEEGVLYLGDTEAKSYGAMKKEAEGVIGKMAEAVDRRMATDPLPRLPSSLKGDDSYFIGKALSDMFSVYQKTSSIDDAKRVGSLWSKFNEQGLTTKEINDLAKEYGTTFRSKAFKRTGEPATSWNGEGYENVRVGVKKTARNLLPDDTARELDEAMSKVYAVKNHSEELADEVMRAKNRVIPQGVMSRLGGALGKGIGWASRKVGLSQLITELAPSLFKADVKLDAVALEKQLASNLRQLRRLNGMNDAGLVDELVRLADEASKSQRTGLSGMLGLEKGPVVTPFSDTSGASMMSVEQAGQAAFGSRRPPMATKALPSPRYVEGQPFKGERPSFADVERMNKLKASEGAQKAYQESKARKNKPAPYR
ncbi:MAG: hypothetical protein M0R06_23950 [Sphaerochaeta sp.]|jgi:hypothetical protein|nr:hypothetical protein [Sphaerochaeta sp.]